jgi:biotin-[acetyl-CoA-carboxylase] ligase BirA-like protein
MSDSTELALERWPEFLEAAIAESSVFRRVMVLRETDSTQDAARRMQATPGDVLVAWQQTRGRGRLERRWIDDHAEGLAMTVLVPAQPAARLSIASALAVVRAVQPHVAPAVGIKWPNDVHVLGRKLAGILIEQFGSSAAVGIGINVKQSQWPAELAHRAISMRQAGAVVDRVQLTANLLQEFEAVLGLDEQQITAEFAQYDLLSGHVATIRCNGRDFSGQIVAIDPLQGLRIQCADGEHWLDAATSTVIAWQ